MTFSFSIRKNIEKQSEHESMPNHSQLEALRRNRIVKSGRNRTSKNWRNLETVKTLAGKLGHLPLASTSSAPSSVAATSAAGAAAGVAGAAAGAVCHEKSSLSTRDVSTLLVHKNVKKTQTVGAQFQHSLQSLMVALNTANPFFVRCIKSNRQKVTFPNCQPSMP